MKISVYGSALGGTNDSGKENAREVGREIARLGHTLLTGACPGYPYEAVLGAREFRGEVWRFSPAVDISEHLQRFQFPTEGFTKFIFTPIDFPYRQQKGACLKLRNVYSVAESDAAVIIGGRWGTVNEFSIAYDLGKNIGVLQKSGGFTDFVLPLINSFQKGSSSKVIFRENPVALVNLLIDITQLK
jgi:predicted Rossmann-fold nucleotide-binding protein